MFLLVSGGHIGVPERDTNMAFPYKALQIQVNCFSQYLAFEKFHRPDSCKGFCIFIFFHFPDSSPSVLNGLHIYFSLRDSASRENINSAVLNPRYDQYPTQAHTGHITPAVAAMDSSFVLVRTHQHNPQPAKSHHHSIFKTKLNAGVALRQRADLLQANNLANKISLPQGQSYTERKYLFTAPKI